MANPSNATNSERSMEGEPETVPGAEKQGRSAPLPSAPSAIEAILPCPCCGYRAELEQAPQEPFTENSGGYYIECKRAGCGITTRLAFAAKDDPVPGLKESWNRRSLASQSAPTLTPLSPENAASRKPFPPEVMAGALQDKIETGPERTRSSTRAITDDEIIATDLESIMVDDLRNSEAWVIGVIRRAVAHLRRAPSATGESELVAACRGLISYWTRNLNNFQWEKADTHVKRINIALGDR